LLLYSLNENERDMFLNLLRKIVKEDDAVPVGAKSTYELLQPSTSTLRIKS